MASAANTIAAVFNAKRNTWRPTVNSSIGDCQSTSVVTIVSKRANAPTCGHLALVAAAASSRAYAEVTNVAEKTAACA
jgi:hypothetical protein